jgi:hypothetical protein
MEVDCFYRGISCPVHEGGHLLFRLGVPLMLASYFVLHRQVQGTAFVYSSFLSNSFRSQPTWPMRAQQLPLLTVGDADYVNHDWN